MKNRIIDEDCGCAGGQAGSGNGSPAKLFFCHLASSPHFPWPPGPVSRGWSPRVTGDLGGEPRACTAAGPGWPPSVLRPQVQELVLKTPVRPSRLCRGLVKGGAGLPVPFPCQLEGKEEAGLGWEGNKKELLGYLGCLGWFVFFSADPKEVTSVVLTAALWMAARARECLWALQAGSRAVAVPVPARVLVPAEAPVEAVAGETALLLMSLRGAVVTVQANTELRCCDLHPCSAAVAAPAEYHRGALQRQTQGQGSA